MGTDVVHFFVPDDEFSAIFLLDNGADANAVIAESLDSPLHLAGKFKSLSKVVEKLVDRGANVNSQNKENL